MAGDRGPLTEEKLRELHASGAYDAFVTYALAAYGGEILGFLVALLGSRAEGDEVFQRFSEDMWVGLPKLRWECSFRTWAYALARNAAYRFRRHEKVRRCVPLSQADVAASAAEPVRTTTVAYLRSDVRDRVRELRDGLEPDDQLLLILRVDRKMSWLELASVMAGPESQGRADEGEMARRAAALRKRFERIKARIREELEGSGSQAGA